MLLQSFNQTKKTNKLASAAVPGFASTAGIAGVIIALYNIGDCVTFQREPGACRDVFRNEIPTLVLGLVAIGGSIGSFFTRNPWIRDKADDLLEILDGKIDRLYEEGSPPHPARFSGPPPVAPVFEAPLSSYEELNKEDLINRVEKEYKVSLAKKLTKDEMLEIVSDLQKLAQRLRNEPVS